MIGAIAALLLMQLAGTLLVQFLRLPLPGPVLGMFLLFALLAWRRQVPEALSRTAQTLLENLSLLFVPAGVGIIAHWHEVAGQAGRIAVVLVLGAAITLAATAWTLHWLLARARTRGLQD
ncbi:CidA/LrgA family protein [Comamonas sp. NLF-1-9]|uniref:CidA/LrgA family protein n=1 Tax=Comamonas sp. NLF-1-9 TaxID=2853163 RepID=UPI001C458E6D|nr:CidA/LrgA family protein [Comamonas sp. NLF-1-9]QXL83795.1 CidA/LrgA family protein [Comamonas sp. NLF-1-9]